MTKRFYIWKDPSCNGKNIEWLELTGKEFFAMLKQPENKARYFIRLGDDIAMEADIIFIEATQEQYLGWRKEQNAHDRLRVINDVYQKVSLDCVTGERETDTLYDVIPNASVDVERDAFARIFVEAPEHYFRHLKDGEYQFLIDLYIKRKTMVQMATERGVTQQAISRRADRLKKRLKKFF